MNQYYKPTGIKINPPTHLTHATTYTTTCSDNLSLKTKFRFRFSFWDRKSQLGLNSGNKTTERDVWTDGRKTQCVVQSRFHCKKQ